MRTFLFAVEHILIATLPAIASAGGKGGGGISGKIGLIPVVVALALVITLLLSPYLYRRALRKKNKSGGKLTTFLMSDPEAREILMSRNRPPQEPEQEDRESD